MVWSQIELAERVFRRLLKGQHTFKALTPELKEGETERDLREALGHLELTGQAKRIPGKSERWRAVTLLSGDYR